MCGNQGEGLDYCVAPFFCDITLHVLLKLGSMHGACADGYHKSRSTLATYFHDLDVAAETKGLL
jgi:hypothetical protein